MSFNGRHPGSESDALEKAIRDLMNKFQNSNPVRPILAVVASLIVLIAAVGSFYTVQPDEQAVVLRLGRYVATQGPGLQFKIPFGVDRIHKLQTQQILQEEFGFRTTSDRGRTSQYMKSGLLQESLMLTGDLNIADVEWVVQYQIADPYRFLFSTSDPKKNIRDISEAVIRRVVGDRLVNSVFERSGMATESRTLIQEVLDYYEMGVRIVAIEFQDVLPPETVRPSFNEVNAARQELEKLINEAEAKYNRVIPRARGIAEQTVSEAEGRAQAIVNRARGEGEKFNTILAEYRRAPRVTRDRLYIETMEEVLSQLDHLTIVDADVKGLLPIFSQESLLKPQKSGRSE